MRAVHVYPAIGYIQSTIENYYHNFLTIVLHCCKFHFLLYFRSIWFSVQFLLYVQEVVTHFYMVTYHIKWVTTVLCKNCLLSGFFIMSLLILIFFLHDLILSITGDFYDRLSRSDLLRFQRYHFRAKNGEREREGVKSVIQSGLRIRILKRLGSGF